MTTFELGKLAVVTGREVVPYLVQLALHEMKVVHQPFRRGGDHSLFPDCLGQFPV